MYDISVIKHPCHYQCFSNILHIYSRTETFYDIQLNVKGSKTLVDSFRHYVKVSLASKQFYLYEVLNFRMSYSYQYTMK